MNETIFREIIYRKEGGSERIHNHMRIVAILLPPFSTENGVSYSVATIRQYRESGSVRVLRKWRRRGATVFIGYCDCHLVTRISDIMAIFPIPIANFRSVALLPRDCLLVYLLDIATILPSS